MGKIYSDFRIDGRFVYSNGASDGKILVSDENGNASWDSPVSSIGIAGSYSYGLVKLGAGISLGDDGSIGFSASNTGAGVDIFSFADSGFEFRSILSGSDAISIRESNGSIILDMSLSIRRERIRYVDPLNGNNTNAGGNQYGGNFLYPYKDYAVALSDSVSGDVIVLLPGIYSDRMRLVDGVDVYVDFGVSITGGFFSEGSVRSSVRGHARFGGSELPALEISSSIGGEIHFEFDRIDGDRQYGLVHRGDGSLVVDGNYVSCSMPVRIDGGHKDLIIGIGIIRSSGGYSIGLSTDESDSGIGGSVSIKSDLIESESDMGVRTCVLIGKSVGSIGQGRHISIEADRIVQSSGSPSSSGISCCVLVDGGDGVLIKSEMFGNKGNCVVNRGGGIVSHHGTIRFQGSMSSDLDVVVSGMFDGEGNGWHSLSFDGVSLRSKGSVVRTEWDGKISGDSGSLYFRNCSLYGVGDVIVLGQGGPDGDFLYLYGSVIYSDGGDGKCISCLGAKSAVIFNTVSNVPCDDISVTGSIQVIDGMVLPH